jgi:hypothetical protein
MSNSRAAAAQVLGSINTARVDPFAGLSKYSNELDARARADAEQVQRDMLFKQQQDDRQQVKDDRAGRIWVQEQLALATPHLYAKDQNYSDSIAGKTAIQSIDGATNITQGPTLNNRASLLPGGTLTKEVPTSKNRVVAAGTPNPKIDFNAYVEGPGEKLPGKSKYSQVVEGIAPVSGIGNVLKLLNSATPSTAEEKLLSTPGMYTSIPGSSARKLNDAGKNALQKGILPGPQVVSKISTDLNSIDFSQAYGKDAKPAGGKDQNTIGADVYFKDRQTGELVNEKAISGVLAKTNMKPTKVETVVGTKTVQIPGLNRVLTSAYKTQGTTPQEVQKVGQDIKAGYRNVIDMLPPDNGAKREELRNIATALYASKGLDPKDYDIGKVVDGLLPKTDISEGQRIAMQTTISAMDKQLEQLNKNREYGLQERKFLTDSIMDKARLSLEQQRVTIAKNQAKSEKLPEMSTILVEAPDGSKAFMPKQGVLPAGYKIVNTSPKAVKEGTTFNVSAYGNQAKISNWIASVKSKGWKDSDINKALSQAPAGDSIADFGKPDLELTYARQYLDSIPAK